MRDWLDDVFRGRPTWMNVVLVFCAYMTFIYVPWDFFWKPTEVDDHRVRRRLPQPPAPPPSTVDREVP